MSGSNILFAFLIGFFVGFFLAGLLFLGDGKKVRTTNDWRRKPGRDPEAPTPDG